MLEAIQQKMLRLILHPEMNAEDIVCSSYPNQRLQVYRQTILDNLVNALAITFPGIWQLLGKTCADNIARAFCHTQHHLPQSGCLDDWGEYFIDFLAIQPTLQPLCYLSEYAQYEWVKHQTYCAPYVPAIEPQQLTTISLTDIETIRFRFIPSMHLMQAAFALEEVQQILEDPSAQPINLGRRTTYALSARTAHGVITCWIAADLAAFITTLQQGSFLSHACEVTLLTHPGFSLTQALHFLLQHQLISHILLKETLDDHCTLQTVY